MNRRSFLTALISFAATAVIDPERLLWRAGAKSIFIPTAHREVSDVIDTIEVIRPQVFFKSYACAIRISESDLERAKTKEFMQRWVSNKYDAALVDRGLVDVWKWA